MKKVIVLLLAGIPMILRLPWILTAWRNSPLDRDGPFYLLAAVVLSIFLRRQMRFRTDKLDYSGMVCVVGAIAGLVYGYINDINSLYMFFGLTLFFGMIWVLWGERVFVCVLPVYIVSVAALPTTTYVTGMLMVSLMGTQIMTGAWIKFVITALMVGIFLLIGFKDVQLKKFYVKRASMIYIVGVILVFLGFLFCDGTAILNKSFQPPFSSLDPEGWIGTSIALSPAETAFFRDYNVAKEVFFSDSAEQITTLSVFSKNDIHRLHPPEYCLLGSGWDISKAKKEMIKIRGENFPVMRIVGKKGERSILAYYWYSSVNESTPSFSVFRRVFRKSDKDHWNLYQVSMNINNLKSSLREDGMLQDFLRKVSEYQ